jgi:hypothetical protein
MAIVRMLITEAGSSGGDCGDIFDDTVEGRWWK